VYAAAVHADFTVGAVENLRCSPLEKVVLSDTTATALESAGGKIQIVSSARILAQAIWRIHSQQSVGWIFDTLREEGDLPPLELMG
jgi:ribose-phosphate pyrophosphokinase